MLARDPRLLCAGRNTKTAEQRYEKCETNSNIRTHERSLGMIAEGKLPLLYLENTVP